MSIRKFKDVTYDLSTTDGFLCNTITPVTATTGESVSAIEVFNDIIVNSADPARPLTSDNMNATIDDIANAVEAKIDVVELNSALAVKADISNVNSQLAAKANTSDVNIALNTKVNASEYNTFKQTTNSALNTKYGETNPPTGLKFKPASVVDTIYSGDTTRLLLKNLFCGFGYIKFLFDLRSGTTFYPNEQGYIVFVKVGSTIASAGIQTDNGYLKTVIPEYENEIQIANNGAAYWTWKGILEEKFVNITL